MKLVILLYFVLINTLIIGQEKFWPVDVEIYIIVEELNGQNEVGIKMETLSHVWKFDNQPASWSFLNTSGEYDAVYFPGVCETVGNTNLPWAYGFNICGSNSFNQPTVGQGLYKLMIFDTSCIFLPFVFYLDHRDCDYPNVSDRAYRPDGSQNPYLFPSVLGGADIWILFNSTTNTCYLSIDGNINWLPIANNEYLSYWNIKSKKNNKPLTKYFPDYWKNCLVLIPSSSGNHPRLVWGPYPDDSFGVDYYKIYKKKGISDFSVAHTTTDFEWTDTDEIIVTGDHHANEVVCYYKISAYVTPRGIGRETGFTNEVNSRVEGEAPGKKNINQSHLNLDYNLTQNYPNPFNPSTEISYSLAENAFVNIAIFDALGRNVMTLVNERKRAGSYTVHFDASELTGGIYFYRIQTPGFTETKKMVLIR